MTKQNAKAPNIYGGRRRGGIIAPLIGGIFSVFWASGVLFGLYFVSGAFTESSIDPAAISDVIASLAWPAVALALGVPTIVLLWAGGAAFLLRLVELRNHLNNLGDYSDTFDNISQLSNDIKNDLETSSRAAVEASNSITNNIELMTARFDQHKASSAQEQPVESDASTDGGFDFADAYSNANELFYIKLRERNERPGMQGRRSLAVVQGGGNKSYIVNKIAEEGLYIDNALADALTIVFDLHLNTRRRSPEPDEIADAKNANQVILQYLAKEFV